jgi:hypothetical protein
VRSRITAYFVVGVAHALFMERPGLNAKTLRRLAEEPVHISQALASDKVVAPPKYPPAIAKPLGFCEKQSSNVLLKLRAPRNECPGDSPPFTVQSTT